jgi:hypothetical protein
MHGDFALIDDRLGTNQSLTVPEQSKKAICQTKQIASEICTYQLRPIFEHFHPLVEKTTCPIINHCREAKDQC